MKNLQLLKKIVVIFILLNMILIPNKIYASATIDDMITSADDFADTSTVEKPVSTIDGNAIQNMSGNIYNILLSIGIVAAVLVGAYLGIQFMVSSVEEKAKIKESLIAYVAGCCVIFGAFGIWKLLVTILGSM